MKTKRTIRTLVALVVVLATLAMTVPAFAAESKVMATTGVNVRSGPGTRYSIVGDLETGEVVVKTGTSKNWTQIVYQGKTAYVYTKYVKAYDGGSVQPASNTIKLSSTTAVYSARNTAAKVVGVIPAGTTVTYSEPGDGWVKVKYNNLTGYIRHSAGSSTIVVPVAGTARVAYASAVRSGPGLTFGVIGAVSAGSTVSLTGDVCGDYTGIYLNNNTVGYVQSACLTNVNSAQTALQSCYEYLYSTGNVPVYTDMVSNNTIGFLALGERVLCVARNSFWAKVYVNNTVGYVRYPSMSSTPQVVPQPQPVPGPYPVLPTTIKTVITNNYSTPVWSTPVPSTSVSTYTMVRGIGTKLTVTGTTCVNGINMYQVYGGGASGYVETSLVTNMLL